MRAASRVFAIAACGLLLASCRSSSGDLPAFEAALAARDSATAALEGWCAAQRIAPRPGITAARIRDEDAPPPHDLDRLLALPQGAPTGYRHVRLSCAGVVLSQAHNWYVPERLTPQMNAMLAGTDIPFGKVAAPTGFTRERLDSKRGASSACPAGTILSHRALLRLPDGAPLALVIECYTNANLQRGN